MQETLLFLLMTAYPPDFVWGAATSAHQAEGGPATAGDWYEFEHRGGTIAGDDTADQGVDFWNRYDEDFRLAKAMGLDSVRISVAWDKIEPKKGEYDRATLSHYREILQSMHRHGLKPMVALHHFTHPRWFHEQGGWPDVQSVEAFTRYSIVVAEALGDLCHEWITFNEPNVQVHLGYWNGTYPPNEKSLVRSLKAAKNLGGAHQAAVHALKARGHSVGLVQSMQKYRNPLTEWLASYAWLDFYRGDIDWLGVNYYGVFPCKEGYRVADNGWCLYPEGLAEVVEATADRYPGLRLIVGENGLADKDDRLRPDILRESLVALDRVAHLVHGYYHWSLTDNFEWLHGYKYRFGLIAVGRDMVRRPRGSYEVYRQEIRKRRPAE